MAEEDGGETEVEVGGEEEEGTRDVVAVVVDTKDVVAAVVDTKDEVVTVVEVEVTVVTVVEVEDPIVIGKTVIMFLYV